MFIFALALSLSYFSFILLFHTSPNPLSAGSQDVLDNVLDRVASVLLVEDQIVKSEALAVANRLPTGLFPFIIS